MTLNKIILTIIAGSLVLTGCQSTSNLSSTQQVNHVVWHSSQLNGFKNGMQLPNNMSRVVFIRPIDNASKQTSANIGIDGRFQTSLQGGHYSDVQICSGLHDFSVQQTGLKTNDLTLDMKSFDLKPQQTYYFFIDISPNKELQMRQITPESAKQQLSNKLKQSHQLSRMVQSEYCL